MVNVRPQPADRPARFNVLLTEDRPRAGTHWTRQFPRLLEPHGVESFIAHTGKEALDVAEHYEIHAAVIDLATPYGSDADRRRTDRLDSGYWLLQLIRKLPNKPPVVAVNPNATQREADRMLQEALRLGAFTVLTGPVQMEQLLGVFRRVLDRHYHGNWPNMKPSPGGPFQ